MFVELSPIVAAAQTGELFRRVLPLALAGIVVAMVLHMGLRLASQSEAAKRAAWNLWDKLVYLGTLGCVAALAATSLVAVMLHGTLGGWPLFLHMFGAGALTAALPVLALSWAHANTFHPGPTNAETPAPKFGPFAKTMFWLLLAGGLVVTMTMLLSMLPIFGSDGLNTLLNIHRYSGLVTVAAAALHAYNVAGLQLALRKFKGTL